MIDWPFAWEEKYINKSKRKMLKDQWSIQFVKNEGCRE